MKRRIVFDPGAVLLLGLLLFALSLQEIVALLLSACVHELGHVAAMLSLGVPIYGVRFAVSGPVIRCGAVSSRMQQFFCALAGPALGVLLAGVIFPFWPLCAEVSLLLSLMNLLPVSPLDGGRALSSLTAGKREEILARTSFLIPVGVMAAGLWLFAQGLGLGLLVFGAWLLILTCQGTENEVK